MKVLIAASDRSELKAFGDKWDKVVTGVGPIISAAAVSKAVAEYGSDIVISVGSAGSCGSLEIGDVVSFGSVVSGDQDLTLYHLPPGATLGARRETIGSISLDPSSSLVLISSAAFAAERPVLRADAADMEAYGTALASTLYNIPCRAVKAITDMIGEKITIADYSAMLRKIRSLIPEKVEELLSGL